MCLLFFTRLLTYPCQYNIFNVSVFLTAINKEVNSNFTVQCVEFMKFDGRIIMYLMKIMPIRETVAGEAKLKSCVSKIKLTFGPNFILHPDGSVKRRLSSSTEFKDSTLL